MNYKTEYALWQVWAKVQAVKSSQDADRIVAPLLWWVSTGRCSGTQEKTIANLSKRQITTVAKRLISCDGFGDYYIAINKVAQYIDELTKSNIVGG